MHKYEEQNRGKWLEHWIDSIKFFQQNIPLDVQIVQRFDYFSEREREETRESDSCWMLNGGVFLDDDDEFST